MSAQKDHRPELVERILSSQDKNGCWNTLSPEHKDFPQLNHYSPLYRSTLWTLILLADIRCDPRLPALKRPLKTITEHFFDKEHGVYSIGRSHFPIPCLNGNMLYLHGYFGYEDSSSDRRVIDFFAEYQRFDDGDFKTPSSFPYCSNRSCYGSHTCYMGVTKLFKGLSFIPRKERSKNAKLLMKRCIDFVLLHKVCFSSHDDSKYLHKGIGRLTFPNMYHSDFLEILWLLKREKIESAEMKKALELLKSKMQPDGTWRIEYRMPDLVTSVRSSVWSEFISERAAMVMKP